jgi:hypothetical protein
MTDASPYTLPEGEIRMKTKNIFKVWLPFAIATTAFCALGYASVQQALRSSFNDPQIQMAEDGAYALGHGAAIESIIPAAKVEMSRSLAPFIVIFDLNGKPVASSGLLDGQMPDYPKGALDSAKQSGENRVTWQPEASVRVASVVVPYTNGFVMAGRNMREVEDREQRIETIAAATWILTLIATLIAITLAEFFLK